MKMTVDDVARLLGKKLTRAERRRIKLELAESEKRWAEAVAPLLQAIRDSQHLTAADYAVTINAR